MDADQPSSAAPKAPPLGPAATMAFLTAEWRSASWDVGIVNDKIT